MNRNDRSMTKVVRVSERTIFCCFFVFFISCWTWAKVMAMMTYVKARKSNVVFGGSPGSKTTTRKNIRKFLTKRYKLFHSPILVNVFVTGMITRMNKTSNFSSIENPKKKKKSTAIKLYFELTSCSTRWKCTITTAKSESWSRVNENESLRRYTLTRWTSIEWCQTDGDCDESKQNENNLNRKIQK